MRIKAKRLMVVTISAVTAGDHCRQGANSGVSVTGTTFQTDCMIPCKTGGMVQQQGALIEGLHALLITHCISQPGSTTPMCEVLAMQASVKAAEGCMHDTKQQTLTVRLV